MSIRSALAALVCVLSALSFASSASAASTRGAQVTITRQCDTTEFGTFCVNDHIVSHFVSTPSGTEVIVNNIRFDQSFTAAAGSGTCSFAQSGRDHLHAVSGPHVNASGGSIRQEFRFPECTGGGSTIVCESVMQFHQVNGVLQFQRSSGRCTEEPET